MSIACKLLCASEAAYCILENSGSASYPANQFICTDSNVINQYNSIGFIDNVYAVNIGIEGCLVGKTNTELIVAFRGTIFNSYLDWLQDFIVEPTSNVNLPGEVHSGFLFAFTLLQPGILSAINALDPNHQLPLYITGHSKGGGIAPVAAMYFHNVNKITATQVITFAGPKPGDVNFATTYNTVFPNHQRYENYLDLVPLLPPDASFINLLEQIPDLPAEVINALNDAKAWNYSAVGSLVYIDSSMQVENPPTPMVIRIAAILYELLVDHDAVEDAHHASCGYGYMTGTCPAGICKTVSS